MERSNSGQSLIELLIALAFGVVLMLTAFGLLQFLIRLAAYDPVLQTGAYLAREEASGVTAAAEGSWAAVGGATAGAQYHVATTSTGFAALPGAATSTANGVVYASYFTVEPVFRDATDAIVASGAPGAAEDAGTKKVAATVSWTYLGRAYSETVEKYVARTASEVMVQTDWSGGPTASGDPVASVFGVPVDFYAVATGTLDYESESGSMKLQGF